MNNIKMKEVIEICEELRLTLGGAKQKQVILELMTNEEVLAEEVNEAWAVIKARHEKARSLQALGGRETAVPLVEKNRIGNPTEFAGA